MVEQAVKTSSETGDFERGKLVRTDTRRGYIISVQTAGCSNRVEYVTPQGECRASPLEDAVCFPEEDIMDHAGQPTGYLGSYEKRHRLDREGGRIDVVAIDSEKAALTFPDSEKPDRQIPTTLLVIFVEMGRYQRA